ncbi:MAG: hypothetical protein GY759_11850 [Chloroflexi bacterium]|nr:hypothetical protein [Chloroflexota bacterium]
MVNILKLSAASYRKQMQNIWWGAGYNIIMISLAVGILALWGIGGFPYRLLWTRFLCLLVPSLCI